MKINRATLKERYGVDLPKGTYRAEIVNGSYLIYGIKDDTSGCILVGQNKEVGKVLNSKVTWTRLMKDYLLPAKRRNEKVYITIE